MTQTLIRKTKLQKENDYYRVVFSIWHKKMYEPNYSNLENASGLPKSSISNWMRGRDMNRERLDKIKNLMYEKG